MRHIVLIAVTFLSVFVRGEIRVVINEVQSSNGDTLTDATGENPDWIELHNAGDEVADLSGWGLSDKAKKPFKWTFPDGTTLAAGAYLVVIADGEDCVVQGELHTSYSLSADGETLLLTRAGADVPDEKLEFGEIPRDCSYGRSADGEHVYFAAPTPGAANSSESYPGIAPGVEFSASRGYCDEPFDLTLKLAEEVSAEIRYTLDHTEPSGTNGLVYAGPIRVAGTTTVRARAVGEGLMPASASVTHTFVFADQVVDQAPVSYAPAIWKDVDGNGAMQSTKASYAPSKTVLGDAEACSNFVSALKALPALALTTDDKGLFHPQEGIYCQPVTLDGTERRVSAEWLNAEDTFGVDAGLQIHGASCRFFNTTPKKTFRLTFRGKYGTSSLDRKVMADGGCDRKGFKKLVLRGENNCSWHWGNGSVQGTSFKDQLFRDLQRAVSGYGLPGTFVHLYLNGLYWGIYNVVEHGDSDYAAAEFGGKEKDWTTAKFHEISDGDGVKYRELMNCVWNQASEMERPSIYAKVCSLLDLDAFIDYMILEYWSCNTDWPDNNVIAVGAVEIGQKFRFLVWDTEFAFVDLNANRLPASRLIYGPQICCNALRRNAAFCRKFAQRAEELFAEGGALSAASVSNHVVRLADRLRPAMFAESARWGAYCHDCRNAKNPVYGLAHWEAEVKRLSTTALSQRLPIFKAQLAAVRLEVSTMPDESEVIEKTPTPPPAPPSRAAWSVPDGYVPAADGPWVAAFICEGGDLEVTVKGIPEGSSCGLRVAETLEELPTTTMTATATCEGGKATFSFTFPALPAQLFIQAF